MAANEFLSNLADAIEDQFSLGENSTRSLKLGNFAKQIDQTAQRKYVEQGYLRLDPYNASPKQFEILTQEPDLTVLVKKRAFASLSENFRLDHMDKDEKLFYKATKILFQNKCKQIAVMEKLSKIEGVSNKTGQLATQLLPIIISLVDSLSLRTTAEVAASEILSGNSGSGMERDLGKLKNVIDKVRRVYQYSNDAKYTEWVSSVGTLSSTLYGQGTGVIELNNVTGISTSLSVGSGGSIGGGTFSLSIVDPYNLMTITQYDIEKALSDATNSNYNKKLFQFTEENLQSSIETAKKKLNDKRRQRGVSAIEFIVSPDTLLSKRVRAIIEANAVDINFTYQPAAGLAGIAPGLGGVTISQEHLKGGPEVGLEGLDTSESVFTNNLETDVTIRRMDSESESSLFSNIISKIFNLLELKVNSRSITKQNNKLTNYARKKLNFHYNGKLIIQSMDQVHIYINSKARTDSKLLGGLQSAFTGYGAIKGINNGIADIRNQFKSLFNPSDSANFQTEKAVFVGSDFPNWLWTILRNQFVNDTSGTHVFGGVVENSTSDCNAGLYNVNITGKDNSYYLQMGKVNLKPSVSVFNGPLLDPLTPLKTKFDTISSNFKNNNPDLLDENKQLLQSSFARFKAGKDSGRKVTEANIIQDHEIQRSSGVIRKVMYSPDGFTYRWKEGIGTYVQFSNAFDVATDNNVGNPAVTKDPFAGQDVMNVISLAVTGIPYNYATFYKAARDSNGFGRDPQTNEDSARSFYKSLTTDLKKNNLLWGNFIPFKNLVMDEEAFKKVLNSQANITDKSEKIDRKLLEIRTLVDALAVKKVRGENVQDPANTLASNKIAKLKEEINNLQFGIVSELSSTNALNIIGNEVSFDYDTFLNTDASNKASLSNPNLRNELRRKVNFLTRRLTWQVRGNDDKNYLIVDDSYDKDYDIMAFEKALNGPEGMQLFNSDYTDVKGKIEIVAKLLNLEVFCDTQGHIRVRPPQYNRIPSSIFYRLLQLKKTSGIQLFPQFIEDLFEDQISSLLQRIEIIEQQIRLDAILLGQVTDDAATILIRGTEFYSSAQGDTEFSFISNSNGDIVEMQGVLNKEPDKAQNSAFVNTLAATNNLIQKQSAIKSAFNANDRSKYLLDNLNSSLSLPESANTVETNTLINKIKESIYIKSGQQVKIDNFYSVTGDVARGAYNKVDIFKVSKDLGDKVAERQRVIKLAASALKNAKEAVSLDDNSLTGTKLLVPDIAKNSNIPEVFANMLEDESYDDYGPGSGSRYIIKNYQIKNLSITETPPSFNAVQVKGQLNPYDSNEDAGVPNVSFFGDGQGGNPLVTAAAVDYDSWRMYGFRLAQPIPAPFLTDAQSQSAPFAATLLSRARQDILQGRLVIAGNEFMQPGDVIYIEDKNLLFYVETVTHSFQYSSSFTTTLTLKYGHSPGEYIPTTLDIMGKLLYNNRDSSSLVNMRQDNSANQLPIGTIVIDRRGSSFSLDISNSVINGSYGEHNIKVINDMLYTTFYSINSNTDTDTNVKSKIELRIFHNGAPDNSLSQAAAYVRSIMIGSVIPEAKSALNKNNLKLKYDDIEIVFIDTTNQSQPRSPSQKSVDMVRNVLATASNQSGTGKSLNTVLYSYIIDCWLVNKKS